MPSRKMIGMRIRTCLAENASSSLWRQFKSRQKEIRDKIDANFYSIQVFDSIPAFHSFSPDTLFDKWAAVEVSDFGRPPEEMATYILPGGTYAVFTYRGGMAEFLAASRYFYDVWLPQSGYELDHRPHFECMDDRYKGPADPNSEEEVWIPVK